MDPLPPDTKAPRDTSSSPRDTTSSPRALEAEARFRQLLADNDLPEPDEVEHRPGELLFLYHDRRLAVVVELAQSSSSSS
jgi:hypothetical protein